VPVNISIRDKICENRAVGEQDFQPEDLAARTQRHNPRTKSKGEGYACQRMKSANGFFAGNIFTSVGTFHPLVKRKCNTTPEIYFQKCGRRGNEPQSSSETSDLRWKQASSRRLLQLFKRIFIGIVETSGKGSV
jgi:hypothetical protein